MVESRDVHIISYQGIPQKGFEVQEHLRMYVDDMLAKGMIPDPRMLSYAKITIYLKDQEKIEPGQIRFTVNKQMWT
jgi:hypothetical protein